MIDDDDFWKETNSVKRLIQGLGCLAVLWYLVLISAVVAGIIWLLNNL